MHRLPASKRHQAAPRKRSALASRWPLAAVVLVALLWRVPSFFDPPWVNDEGTYFAVAQAMAHGYRLYAGVWENKPPALYLVYTAVYHSVGPSLLAIRLLTAGVVVGLVTATFRLASMYAGRPAALAASMLAGLVFGVPFLEGTTGNAEIFLALLTALGVILVMSYGLPMPGGIAIGAAILFKAPAGFDSVAVGLWLLLYRRKDVLPFALGAGLVLAVTVVLAWLAGILGPMLRDALLYDFGYVGSKNGGGVPWLLLAKLALLITGTILLRRAPFPALWLLYAAAGSLVSGRVFGHYFLQAVVPFCVLAAILLRERPALSCRALWGLPVIFVLLAGLSAVAGWAMAAAGYNTILARRLQWYASFVRYATGNESRSTYYAQIDDHVNRNIAVAQRLRRLPAGLLLVWGNTPWVYVLSARLPATPYTSALRDPPVPGETATLRRAVDGNRSREVVVIAPPQPPLGSAAGGLRTGYRLVARVGNASIFVSACRTARCRASAASTATVSKGTR